MHGCYRLVVYLLHAGVSFCSMAPHMSLVSEHRGLTNQHEWLHEAKAASDSTLSSIEEQLVAATVAKVHADGNKYSVSIE